MKQRLLVSLAVVAAAYMLLMLDGSALETFASVRSSEGSGVSSSFLPALEIWSSPERIISATSNCANPALAIDRSTKGLHLAWEEAGEGENTTHYAYRDLLGWHIEALSASQGDSPAIALDALGLPHIVYAKTISDQIQIYHRARNLDDWGLPGRVSQAPGQCADPDISLVISDEIDLVWATSLGAVKQLYHARSTDNGNSWGLIEPVLFGTSYAYGYAPSLASAPGGGLWVAYQGDPSLASAGAADVYALQWSEGQWLSPTNVSQGPAGYYSRGADIACDSRGRAHLVWEEEAPDGRLFIQYASYSSGNWSAPQRLSPPTESATRPCIAVGPDDTVYVAWVAGRALSFRKRGSSGMWGTLERIASDQVGLRGVTIAADGDSVYVVWNARSTSGVSELFFSRRLPNLVLTPTTTPTVSPTNTPEATVTPTEKPQQTATIPLAETPTSTPSATPGATASPTETQTETPSPTLTPSATATLEATLPSPTLTLTATFTGTPTATHTPTPTQTATASPTPLPTGTQPPSPTPTNTAVLIPRVFVPAVSRPTGVDSSLEGGKGVPGIEPPPSNVLPQLLPAWSWSANVENISSSSWDSRQAAVVAAANGTVYAVWQELTPTGHWVLCSSIRTGNVWSMPVCFFAGEQPDLAIAPDGQVHLVYANEMFGNYEIYYTTWLSGHWVASKNVSNTKEGVSSQPAVTVGEDGKPVVVWTDTTGGQEYIYFARQNNGVWETYWVSSTYEGSAPDVALGKNGRLWLTWQTKEGGYYDVFALFGDGQSWNREAVDVSVSENADSTAPRLAGDDSWGAFLVWQEDRGSSAAVYYADTLEGIDWWSVPVNISQVAGRSEQPSIAANAAGDVHVAWDQGSQLLHRHRDPSTQQWLPLHVIADDLADLGEIELAAGPGREIHALWSKPLASGKRDIYYRKGYLVWPYHLELPLLFSP